MWPTDKMHQLFDKLNLVNDQKTEAFLHKEYFGFFRLSGIYLPYDKRRRLLSVIQLILVLALLGIHLVAIGKPTFSLAEISFVIFGQNIHFCLLINLVIIVLVSIQTKHNQMILFHKAIANNFFDYSEPYVGIAEDLQKEMRRERMLLLPIPVSVGVAASGVLVMAPILNKYGTFDFNTTSNLVNNNLPFAFTEYPYSSHDGIGLYASFVMQMLLGTVISLFIGTGGFAYIVMSQNLSIQMKILLDCIENIEKRATLLILQQFGLKLTLAGSKLYKRHEFVYCYNVCLKKTFQHHQIIISNFNLWTEIFSLPVFVAYLTGTIVIALSLLSTGSWSELPGTTIVSFVLCGAEVGYMFLFSVFSQRITDLNEELRFKMYSIKWYLCDEGVKRSLRIFQVMTLRPMTLMAGGIVPANMDTFASVMNSAYSYYNLVNAFNTVD